MLGVLRPNLRHLAGGYAAYRFPRFQLCTSLQFRSPARHQPCSSASAASPTGWERPTTSRSATSGVQAGVGSDLQTSTMSTAAGPEYSLAQLEQHLGTLSRTSTLCPPQPIVIVISGPSGVGKDAVIKRLEHLRPDLYFVVTATSRGRRPGEADGVDYIFVSKEQFEQWIAQGELLEHAVVYGEYKGIPKQQVSNALALGTDVVLRIDVQGAATVKQLLPGIVTIFLVAESEAELVQRLLDRKTEAFDKMVVRVETARQELARIQEFDYVVVNRDGQLDDTVQQLACIIDTEKSRTHRRLAAVPSSSTMSV